MSAASNCDGRKFHGWAVADADGVKVGAKVEVWDAVAVKVSVGIGVFVALGVNVAASAVAVGVIPAPPTEQLTIKYATAVKAMILPYGPNLSEFLSI